MDRFTKEKRSEVMSRIKGRGNRKTELALIAIMKKHGITGWRRNQPVFGKPDFVFRKWKLAVFVDGCFWHGCPNHYIAPKDNSRYWLEKITRNRKRDKVVARTLRSKEWKVLRLWECELGDSRRVIRRLKPLLSDSVNSFRHS